MKPSVRIAVAVVIAAVLCGVLIVGFAIQREADQVREDETAEAIMEAVERTAAKEASGEAAGNASSAENAENAAGAENASNEATEAAGGAVELSVVDAEVTDKTINVLCFGDSNTYGYSPTSRTGRYQTSQIWPTLLLQELGEGYTVVNDGLNGRTTAFNYGRSSTANGLAALPSTLAQCNPVDVVVFMLGTNECVTEFNLTSEEVTRGMEQLVTTTIETTEAAQGYAPEILIVVPPAYPEVLIDMSDEIDAGSVQKSEDLVDLYRELADKYDCWYLDASVGFDLSTGDYSHLTVLGHSQLADAVYGVISQMSLPRAASVLG